MLTADAAFEIWDYKSTFGDGNSHELTDTVFVNRGKRIVREYPIFHIFDHETRFRVIPGDAECRLGEIIRSE